MGGGVMRKRRNISVYIDRSGSYLLLQSGWIGNNEHANTGSCFVTH